MADQPSSSTPKAIGSTVKKPSDVTRQGTQKLKFVPTLPQRRKKEEVKPEPTAVAIPPANERGRGRGRGRGEGRGRGRGRSGPPVVEMTASGPFAMGPALAGSSSRRSTPRSNFAPTVPEDSAMGSNIGNLSESAPPALRRARNDLTSAAVKEEQEEYSDPDEGVEIVDIENVRQMDWMAPESLRKERKDAKKKDKKVKKEEDANDVEMPIEASNALNLSASEEEEELEDIIEDFSAKSTLETDDNMHEDRLYSFQFPTPFPKFEYKQVPAVQPVDAPEAESSTSKKVSFAADVKPGVDSTTASRTSSTVPSEAKQEQQQPLDGIIGQLEMYKSGAVMIRLANGILLDVSAATQPSFLQQAVALDQDKKQLNILGEVNKQFVVSPNIDALLAALETEQNVTTIPGEEGLITME